MSDNLVYITVNCGAAHNLPFKVGGWAMIVLCDRFKIELSGHFQEAVQSETEAEIKCIANALHAVAKTLETHPFTFDVLLVNAGSKTTVKAISERKGKEAKTEHARKIWQIASQIINTHYCKFEIRLVESAAKNHGVNRWLYTQSHKECAEMIGKKMEEKKKMDYLSK